jgi:hypothetical protein
MPLVANRSSRHRMSSFYRVSTLEKIYWGASGVAFHADRLKLETLQKNGPIAGTTRAKAQKWSFQLKRRCLMMSSPVQYSNQGLLCLRDQMVSTFAAGHEFPRGSTSRSAVWLTHRALVLFGINPASQE